MVVQSAQLDGTQEHARPRDRIRIGAGDAQAVECAVATHETDMGALDRPR